MKISPKSIFYHKFLLYNLIRSEIRSRYKQTALGLAWVVVQPIFTMLVFTVVFSKFAKIPSDGIPYPLFAYSALIPWAFLSSSLGRGTNSLVAYSALLRKTYFPREIIPLSFILSSFFDMVVSSGVFVLLAYYYKVTLSMAVLWVLPVILIEFIFIYGLVLIFSALNIFARDIVQAVPLVLQAWMFLTPIAYPLSLVPDKIKPFYMLNPMVAITNSCREAIVKGHISDWGGLLIATVVSLLVFLLGYAVFKKFEMKFVDVI